MGRPLDIEALRTAAQGNDTDVVPVSRRWLKEVLCQLEAPAVLDHVPFATVDGRGLALSRVD